MEEGVDVLTSSATDSPPQSGSLSSLRQTLEEYRLDGKPVQDSDQEEEQDVDTSEVGTSEVMGNFSSPMRVPSGLVQSMDALHHHQQQDGEAIRCVCEGVDDDGFTIQCDGCLVWQHAICVGIGKESVPESYFCEICRPEMHQKVLGNFY